FGGAPSLVVAIVAGGGLLLVAAEADSQVVFIAAWGAGSGIVSAGAFYNVTMPITARRFPDRRPLAFSVLTFVGGLASPIYFPLAAFFVDQWGWRVAIQLLVATLPVTVLPAAFVRTRLPLVRDDRDDRDDRDGPGRSLAETTGFDSVREAYRSRRVLQMLAMFLLSGIAFSALQVHQVPVMTAAGISLAAAASAAAIRGMLSLPGRALIAVLVSRLGLLRGVIAVNGAMTLGIVALMGAGAIPLVAVYVLLTGLAFGMYAPLTNLYAIEVYGERRMGTLLGVQRAVVGPAAALGPILVGVSADATGGFALGLAGMFATSLAALALMVTMPAPARPPDGPGQADYSPSQR
ncbi:MAG: MFS transporter, partial [Dehalococcoidia bacterium]|nr:MFS transporter [Dehalococcoidia bacterium]